MKNLLQIFLLTISLTAYAQSDSTTLTLTQSNSEVHDSSNIFFIGEVAYNVATGEVVALIEEDTATASYAEIGKWLSIDPLADKYVEYSPYCFVGDNPIQYVDPNGESIKPVNPDAQILLKTALNSFGGTNFMNALGIVESPKSGALSAIPLKIENEKDFRKALKKNNIRLRGNDLTNAYNLYTKILDKKETELSVLAKSEQAFTYEEGQEGTQVVEGENSTTNENYVEFQEKFDKNNNALDEETGDADYSIIEYQPQPGSGVSSSQHNGTIVIDSTGDTNAAQTLNTLFQAIR